ncbi:MAG TPA: hypothetical protein VFL59_10395 [Candidatus Nanopelagicales bacterium]|nr:hypothetical protein [Candidatus Nanopelagicales bacterium]
MRDDQRGYAAGMGWAALTVIAAATLGKPPSPSASTAEVASYFVDHQQAVAVGSTVSAVSALLFLLFAVSLADRLSAAWPAAVVRAAGAVTAALAVLGGALQAALAQSAARLDPSAVSAVWTVVWPVFYLTPPLVLSLLLANAAFGLRATTVPRWVGVSAGLLAALAFLAGVAGLVTASTTVLGIGFAGLVLTMIWVLATSIALWRSAAPAASDKQPALLAH